ncbi:MAG: hypothetical protein U0271_06635 [Polyangiaceae bacterium]
MESGGPLVTGDWTSSAVSVEELEVAFHVLLQLGELPPGSYTYDNPLATYSSNEWQIDAYSAATMPIRKETPLTFELTREHLTLLRAAGSTGERLGIDGKRPYGDSSCFYLDMASLLGDRYGQGDTCEGRFSRVQLERYDRLHRSMVYALQVFLRFAKLDMATYERVGFGLWTKAQP